MYRLGFHNHTAPSMRIGATANASGIATGFLGPVPLGYCWYVERMTCFSTTAAMAPVLEIFVLAEQNLPANYTASTGTRQGRQDMSLSPQNDVADEGTPIYVPEGYFLVAGWTGLTSQDNATVTAQVAVHQLNMEYANTVRDVGALHQYYHEQDALQALASPEGHN